MKYVINSPIITFTLDIKDPLDDSQVRAMIRNVIDTVAFDQNPPQYRLEFHNTADGETEVSIDVFSDVVYVDRFW